MRRAVQVMRDVPPNTEENRRSVGANQFANDVKRDVNLLVSQIREADKVGYRSPELKYLLSTYLRDGQKVGLDAQDLAALRALQPQHEGDEGASASGAASNASNDRSQTQQQVPRRRRERFEANTRKIIERANQALAQGAEGSVLMDLWRELERAYSRAWVSADLRERIASVMQQIERRKIPPDATLELRVVPSLEPVSETGEKRKGGTETDFGPLLGKAAELAAKESWRSPSVREVEEELRKAIKRIGPHWSSLRHTLEDALGRLEKLPG
jgi:hypothetical protein